MKTPAYKYIVVEGPIGVGKTTLAAKLAEHYKAEILHEQVEENPFLSRFYLDMEKFAFSAQMFFLMSRYQQLKKSNQIDLFSSCVVADYMLEKDFIFAELNLNKDEFNLYNDVYRMLQGHVAKPDLVIFLSAETETLIKRIRKRGRSFEKAIPEKYIEEVNEAYHRFFFQYGSGPMLQVNSNKMDFVNNEEDFSKLIEKLSTRIRGKEYFNPLGSV
ncbi:MAG: deoxynucleoside kinase [Nitrospinota bacterium]|nr:deoxynucleoside kinase [Nitrospinota bacterium]